MPKAEVDINVLTESEVRKLCEKWGLDNIKSFTKLYGGFSGTNYKIVTNNASMTVLKVSNGYSAHDVETLCSMLMFAKSNGFSRACFPLPVAACGEDVTGNGASQAAKYVDVSLGSDKPAIMLTYVAGTAADKVMEGGQIDARDGMVAIGRLLAELHMVKVPRDPSQWSSLGLRSYKEGGACEVYNHIAGKFLEAFEEAASNPDLSDVKTNPYLAFYSQARVELVENMALAETSSEGGGFPSGILHGDPFLDNILCTIDEPSGSGFVPRLVDFEDISVGPLIFDVAVCAIGCCYKDSDNKLDLVRLAGLLEGYQSIRPLTEAERSRFAAFMRLALLCNCSWRFRNFNIDHREIEECRNAHVELWDRIKVLAEGSDLAKRVLALCNDGSMPAPTV